MASRSLNRVLGETSLERKLFILFSLCLGILIAASFLWYGRQTDKLVHDAHRHVGELLRATAVMERHIEMLDKGDEWQPAGKALAEAMRSHQYQYRFFLRTRNNEENVLQPDEADEFVWDLLINWERQGLGVIEDAPSFAVRPLADPNKYQYYEPIFAVNSCVDCHKIVATKPDPDLKVGDLMAVIEVTVTDLETPKARNLNRAILYTTAILTAFFALIALYFIVRVVVVRPLKHLRHVSEEISRGNTDMRADIHTGDEFEELGAAFNRMLRHLTATQDELRHINTDLDAKVDQLAQANMKLYDMNRLKSDFLATVSHELRTPLNSILGFSEVLGSIDSLNDKQSRYVKNIQRSGRMLLEMINDILDLAKIESGKLKIHLSQFPIDRVIAAQCDMARPLTERKNIDLEYEVEPNLPELVQDQGKIQQILNNLLSNAIKFTPEGGRIDVFASREAAGQLKLVVVDTGVGISEEDQSAVFEKFRQGTTVLPGGDAMTREYSGAGLGLSIVKELCRLLGGEISLESELGKGSTFTVVLPWTRTEQPRMESELDEKLDGLTSERPQLFLQSDKAAESNDDSLSAPGSSR